VRAVRTPSRLAAVPGMARNLLLTLLAALAIAGCGGEDQSIPTDQGETLLTRLDEIEGAVDDGNCDGAEASAQLFASQVSDLPAEVDEEVKRLLTSGAESLTALVANCEPADTGPTGEEGFEPLPETTAPPVEPPPEETTTETTTTEEGDADDGGPPEQGGGNSQGGGAPTGGTGDWDE
jgi:hypothetical protein